MRILMLSTLFPYAGKPRFGTFVEKRAQMMAAQAGVELRVVAPVGLPPLGLKYLPLYAEKRATPCEEIWQGLLVYRPRFAHIPSTQGRYDAANLARALTPLLHKIRKDFPFDVIDAQFFFPDAVAAAQLGQAFGVPTSVTARGGDIHYWGEQPATKPMIVAASKRLSGMIAVSQALRRDMITLGIDGNSIEVLRPGIDRELFYPRDARALKKELGVTGRLAVTVGTLDENKGQYLVLEALRELSDVPDLHYWIAGEGPFRPKLVEKIASFGLNDRVRLLGNVDRVQVAKLMAAADIMVMPSAHEGLANVWLEALASGTPIVVCDAGGIAEVLVEDRCGRIVARNPKAIALGIREVLSQNNCREDVCATVAHFNWEQKTDFLMQHLSRLVEKSK